MRAWLRPTVRFAQRWLLRLGAMALGGVAGGMLVTHLWSIGQHPRLMNGALLVWSVMGLLSLGSWALRPRLKVGGFSGYTGWLLAAGAGSALATHNPWVATLLFGQVLLDITWSCLGDWLLDQEQQGPFQSRRAPSGRAEPAPVITRSTRRSGRPLAAAEDRRIASPAVDKAMAPEVPSETLDDLMGMRSTVGRFMAALETCLADPRASNGILLFGPPGNGKTLLVRAACGSLGRPLVHVSHADLATPWLGQAARGLADTFDAVMRHPGAVLFLDEIDAVIPDRQRSALHDLEAGKTANAFLAKVNEARAAGLVVIGATNFLERLDAAAIREGRFDHKIEVPNPDLEARTALLAKYAPGMPLEQRERTALRLNGHSVARIRMVAEKATQMANGQPIDWSRFEQALRLVQSSLGESLDGIPALSSLVIEEPAGTRLAHLAKGLHATDRLLEMGGQPPCGALFLGPPGTGKTLAARALAKELSMAFFSTNGFDLARDESAIDAFFQRGREARPAVLFIDEAEDLLRDRSLGGRGFLTGKMLSVLDGANGKTPDVFVICASNHPDQIDPAFLRPGRLSESIAFVVPSAATLERLVAQRLKTLPARVAGDLSAAALAQAWLGLTPAAVHEAFNQAVALAVHAGRDALTLQDVQQAREQLNV